MGYQDTWNLESVFEGGPNSPALHEKLELVKGQIKSFKDKIEAWQTNQGQVDQDQFADILADRAKIAKGLNQAGTFANAHLSADVNDTVSLNNLNQVSLLGHDFSQTLTLLSKKIQEINEDDWQNLLQEDPFKDLAFRLNEIRRDANQLLHPDQEKIISQLSPDGYQGWESMYNDLVAQVKVPIEEDGKVNYYSAGQAQNKLTSQEDPSKRAEILNAWEQAWQDKASLFATTLNHIVGFNLANQALHGEEDYLKPALENNRLNQKSLDTMWETINQNKDHVIKYMERKAQLQGLDQLGWPDLEAPLTVGEFKPVTYSFDQAAEFIMDNFAQVSPQMKDLAQKAFEGAWIEAEDRANKRPGGYCSDLPESHESRIFMTFSGSPDNVSTLAHELGHAFHSYVLRDQAYLNQEYAMNVAETASTFAEMVVSDATIQNANSIEEKISLLDSKISRAAVMFMNIQSRFIFEKSFYAERKTGLVSPDRANELMLEAQKQAFGDSLSVYHPTFWASKLHFYMTDQAFYNFPYTFGFLFSMGIYAQAKEAGDQFEDRYIDLLKDTASMTSEDLVQKHLGYNLEEPDFWQSAIDLVKQDIDEFLDLTEAYL